MTKILRNIVGFAIAAATAISTVSASPPYLKHRVIPLNYPAPPQKSVSEGQKCDDGLKRSYSPDANTKVTLVHFFRKGDDLNLNGQATGVIAPDDVCLVKLNVGPGNPGPAGAPSTSPGIGIEIWLPSSAKWNNRIHAFGSGGFAGSPFISSLTDFEMKPNGVAGRLVLYPAAGAVVTAVEGSVTAIQDGGHATRLSEFSQGSFGLNPDGSLNKASLLDFSHRGIHEMAVKTKALTAHYYGRPAAHSYLTGSSGGGRDAMQTSQLHDDFDGILSSNPAMFWSRFITYELYPQVVIQNDLGGRPPTAAQLEAVSSAAVSACDTAITGVHDGWITDPSTCRYDPTKDASVLCKSDGGNNETRACVTRAIALAINKIWYGMTEDGSVPDPAVSLGQGPDLDVANKQLWFGVSRSADLASLAGTAPDGTGTPFPISADQVALELEDPSISMPQFKNAKSDGLNGWKKLSYADLARAYKRGVELQPEFSLANAENPDLSRLRDRNAKLILAWAVDDEVIPFAAGPYYYNQVAQKMGGVGEVQKFFRFYPIPGTNHVYGVTNVNGLPGVSPEADPPYYQDGDPVIYYGKLFQRLVDWVEKGQAPQQIIVSDARGRNARPLCAYPEKLVYNGGDRSKADSFACQ